MNIKTGIVSAIIATSPITVSAQKTTKNITKPQTTERVTNLVKETGNYGKVLVKQLKDVPPIVSEPNVNMANLVKINPDKTQIKYDAYGNASKFYNSKGQKVREINRESDGTLIDYSDNTFRKDGSKKSETIYANNWASDGSVGMFAKHEYHGNGTATVTHFDQYGKSIQSKKYNTAIIDDEDQITTLFK